MRASDAKLSAALHQAGLDDLAARATAGEFNDFFSERPTPKIVLVRLLRSLRTDAGAQLSKRVIDGEFDSGRDEMQEWRDSPEGQAAFAELMGGGQ